MLNICVACINAASQPVTWDLDREVNISSRYCFLVKLWLCLYEKMDLSSSNLDLNKRARPVNDLNTMQILWRKNTWAEPVY